MPERKKARGVQVRFTAADGTDWTVWDVTWSKKKHHRRPHGDPTATERVFVNAEGAAVPAMVQGADSQRRALTMKRTTGLTLAAFLSGCSGTVEPQLYDLSLTSVDGVAPPVVLQAANPRVEILGGTLSGGPHRDFCDFRIVERTTFLEGAVTTGEIGGQESCEWVDDRIARVTIGLTSGGTHVYSFSR